MSHFGWVVHKVIEKSDIVLEILDARFIEETRNLENENKIKNRGKILVHVINKCDYVDKKSLELAKKDLVNCVFVSAKKHLGTTMLKQKIKMLAKREKIKEPIVGVIGYPNVGKSSVINALKGKGSAKTSSEAGFTKGKQYLRISQNIMMIDTPGVIDKNKTEEGSLVLIGAKNPSNMEDPDLSVLKLMEDHPGLLETNYGVPVGRDNEKTLERISLKLNFKMKGGTADIERASRNILRDWLNGKIKD
jgi:ribosome biogenesis GTPase A